MQIHPKQTVPARVEANRSAQPADIAETTPAVSSTPSSADRSDKVVISDAGRALAARGGDSASSGLDPARAASIRGRIIGGAYDTLEVVDAVARRLLASHDL